MRFRGHVHGFARLVSGLAIVTMVIPGAVTAQTTVADANLESVKAYLVEHVGKSKAGTAKVLSQAERYYDLAETSDFDYQALWDANGPEIATLLADARQAWAEEASANYELSEGLVAGVPSLAYYDVWIDAGPSGADDPINALDVSVELPDGRVLEKPGSLYHYITEPVLGAPTMSSSGCALTWMATVRSSSARRCQRRTRSSVGRARSMRRRGNSSKR
jgi:hypothetical protein